MPRRHGKEAGQRQAWEAWVLKGLEREGVDYQRGSRITKGTVLDARDGRV